MAREPARPKTWARRMFMMKGRLSSMAYCREERKRGGRGGRGRGGGGGGGGEEGKGEGRGRRRGRGRGRGRAGTCRHGYERYESEPSACTHQVRGEAIDDATNLKGETLD